MTQFRSPNQEILFALETSTHMATWTEFAAFQDASSDVVAAIVEEAGKLTTDIIAPTNVLGDREGARLVDGVVHAPESFQQIADLYRDGGWASLPWPSEYGGQELPLTLALAVQEMFSAGNMAYFLNPMLTMGTIEALLAYGTPEQISTYVPKLVAGVWSGAMNLTEPQAGSDVGALKTKATAIGEGVYHLQGTKIFITWGDHSLSENIVHLVLARIEGAPEGTKGISMFLVPKYHVKDDGSLGDKNDIVCSKLEEKLGIHGSPTCVLNFGDKGQCVGYLVGKENQGMRAMFTMMNNARINVGLQGIAVAERAYQAAVYYAQDRIQSKPVDGSSESSVPIIQHPDVRRMLMTMRALTEAGRALTYRTIWAVDTHKNHGDEKIRTMAKGEADLLTPLAKAWGSDIGCEVASLAMQVCGGMGYIEETGVAQYFRDARIAPIYEGTNGIQSMDLVMRKLTMDDGVYWQALLAEMKAWIKNSKGHEPMKVMALADAVAALEEAIAYIVSNAMEKVKDTAAVATLFLRLFATTVGGYELCKQAVAAGIYAKDKDGHGYDASFLKTKQATAAFFLDHILPQATGLLISIKAGSSTLYAIEDGEF